MKLVVVFRVLRSAFRVQCSVFRVPCSVFRVSGFGLIRKTTPATDQFKS